MFFRRVTVPRDKLTVLSSSEMRGGGRGGKERVENTSFYDSSEEIKINPDVSAPRLSLHPTAG